MAKSNVVSINRNRRPEPEPKPRPPLGEPGSGHVPISWHKDEKVAAECCCGWPRTGFWRDAQGSQWHGGKTQYEMVKADYAGHLAKVRATEAGS